jgi:hypothetical protein
MTAWAPAPPLREHKEGTDEQVQATSRNAGSTRTARSGKAEEKADYTSGGEERKEGKEEQRA